MIYYLRAVGRLVRLEKSVTDCQLERNVLVLTSIEKSSFEIG